MSAPQNLRMVKFGLVKKNEIAAYQDIFHFGIVITRQALIDPSMYYTKLLCNLETSGATILIEWTLRVYGWAPGPPEGMC
jgi:hypothetical protein